MRAGFEINRRHLELRSCTWGAYQRVRIDPLPRTTDAQASNLGKWRYVMCLPLHVLTSALFVFDYDGRTTQCNPYTNRQGCPPSCCPPLLLHARASHALLCLALCLSPSLWLIANFLVDVLPMKNEQLMHIRTTLVIARLCDWLVLSLWTLCLHGRISICINTSGGVDNYSERACLRGAIGKRLPAECESL